MKAYPISPDIKSPGSNNKELLNPTGERVAPEVPAMIVTQLRSRRMGIKRRIAMMRKDQRWEKETYNRNTG